jgi:signal peptide peptidase-like protein 3
MQAFIVGLAYSVVDSSRLSTFIISILLIVYGSFRSLNIEREHKEKEKEKDKLAVTSTFTPNAVPASDTNSGTQTIDVWQALFMPFGASLSLLIMFLFFDSLQIIFAISTAILATIAFAFLLLPMCQHLTRPCGCTNKISFGCCGRFTSAEVLSFCVSFVIVCVWILTGHWLLMDALGMGLCVAFIALVQLPSLKVSTFLLVGLLIYDVFWVFFSSYIFSTNVMVKVATRPAENPIGILAKKLHLTSLTNNSPKLSLPGKLVFPSVRNAGHFSMLGLGDIVMPGLLLCFVLRYEAYKRNQPSNDIGVPAPPNVYQRITYFHCSLIGYFLGLLTSTISSELFQTAQPALLYLVPFTLMPLLTMAYLKGDLRRMWSEPFRARSPPKYIDV